MKSRYDELAKATKSLMFREPYYGLFLLMLQKKWIQEGTAQVSIEGVNYTLGICEDFWNKLNEKTQQGLLKHELAHIIFFHLTDFDHLKDKEIANIAMDIEINQYIDSEYLPEGGCTIEAFSYLNLEPMKGTQYYYDKLMDYKNKGDQSLAVCLSNMKNRQFEAELPNGKKIRLPKHDWDNIQMNEAAIKVIKRHTENLIKEVASQVSKFNGTLPREISEILEALEITEEPKYDWRGYIRRFASKSQKIYTKKSRRKYNKRLQENPGLKIKKRKCILVGIDTSASIQKDELVEFLQEIYHLQKTENEVIIAQCDAAISSLGPINLNKEIKITGRGGTDFQPLIDYYNSNRNKYSCLIYFTDGEAPIPENCIKPETLWVLSQKSNFNKNLPGKIIQLN